MYYYYTSLKYYNYTYIPSRELPFTDDNTQLAVEGSKLCCIREASYEVYVPSDYIKRKRCKASGDPTKETVPPAVGDKTLDPVPLAGDEVGNSGLVLKYDIVSLIVVNSIWNLAEARTTQRCITRVS